MKFHTWREDAAPIIAEVIKRVGREDPAALRRALRDAYPYGPRSNYPYKVWRDEIRRQLNPEAPKFAERRQNLEPSPGQLPLL